MKYKSELIKDIVDTRGHKKSSLHYESECIGAWIEETKGAYPKLCDYESEWLNYITVNGEIGEFPYETLTANPTATVNHVVPYEYKSAILKGQTLVNIHPKNYKIGMNTDTIFSVNTNIDISLIKPNTKYFIRIYNAPSNICRVYFKPCDTVSVTFTDINNKYTIHTTKSDLSEYTDAGRIHLYTSEGTTATQADVENIKVIVCEYQDGMENWDIPYFEGMQSVKMPVLTTTGKNLFDGKWIKGKWISEDGSIISDSGSQYSESFIRVSKGKYISSNNGTNRNVNIFKYDFDGNFIGRLGAAGSTFTIDGDCLIRFSLGLNNTDYFQFEQGTVATTYEPHKTNILNVNEDVELRGIGNVKDELNLLTGEYIQRVDEVVWDGSDDERWTYNKDYNVFVYESLMYSNNYLSTNIVEKIRWNGIDRFALKPSKYGFTSHKEGMEYLKNNPITIQYQLATESIKTVDLTVVNQDNETLDKIKPFEGTMNINVTGNPINPIGVFEIPVEAITQNLNSFIEEE